MAPHAVLFQALVDWDCEHLRLRRDTHDHASGPAPNGDDEQRMVPVSGGPHAWSAIGNKKSCTMQLPSLLGAWVIGA